jgi:hypothetical protein
MACLHVLSIQPGQPGLISEESTAHPSAFLSLVDYALLATPAAPGQQSGAHTFTSMPASANESRRFCAWAGAWEPHPITPTLLMPAKAAGSLAYLSRPPLQEEEGKRKQGGRAGCGVQSAGQRWVGGGRGPQPLVWGRSSPLLASPLPRFRLRLLLAAVRHCRPPCHLRPGTYGRPLRRPPATRRR